MENKIQENYLSFLPISPKNIMPNDEWLGYPTKIIKLE